MMNSRLALAWIWRHVALVWVWLRVGLSNTKYLVCKASWLGWYLLGLEERVGSFFGVSLLAMLVFVKGAGKVIDLV